MRRFVLRMNCLMLLLGLFRGYLSMIVLLGFVWFIRHVNSWICYKVFCHSEVIYDLGISITCFSSALEYPVPVKTKLMQMYLRKRGIAYCYQRK